MFERCLYFNTNALARTVNQIWADAYKEFGLSPAHAFLLRLVLAHPGLLQREIADELGLARSTVTRFIDVLEARGYLRRQHSDADGREQQVFPTRKAVQVRNGLERTGAMLSQAMTDALGETLLLGTVRNLRRIRQTLEGTT